MLGVGLYFSVRGLKFLSLFRWERGEISRKFRENFEISFIFLNCVEIQLPFSSKFRQNFEISKNRFFVGKISTVRKSVTGTLRQDLYVAYDRNQFGVTWYIS